MTFAHGVSGYRRHHCRCDLCCTAYKEARTRWRTQDKLTRAARQAGAGPESTSLQASLQRAREERERAIAELGEPDDPGVCYVCLEICHWLSLGESLEQLAVALRIQVETLHYHWVRHRPMGDDPWPLPLSGSPRLRRHRSSEAAKVRRDLVRDAAAALGLTGNVYRQRYGRSARVAQQILTPTETERTA